MRHPVGPRRTVRRAAKVNAAQTAISMLSALTRPPIDVSPGSSATTPVAIVRGHVAANTSAAASHANKTVSRNSSPLASRITMSRSQKEPAEPR